MVKKLVLQTLLLVIVWSVASTNAHAQFDPQAICSMTVAPLSQPATVYRSSEAYQVVGEPSSWVIENDCSVDSTAKIKRWIDAVPDNSTLLFEQGCYLLDNTLQISGRNNLTFTGEVPLVDATKKAAMEDWMTHKTLFKRVSHTLSDPLCATSFACRNFIQWNVQNSTNIAIKNMEIEGSNKTEGDKPGYMVYSGYMEAQHAISFINNSGGLIENVTTNYTYGDGVYISGTNTRNILVRNVIIKNNGRQGIGFTEGDSIEFDTILVTNSRRGGIDFEPNFKEAVINNVVLRNSALLTWLLHLPSGGRGTVSNVCIKDNIFRSGSRSWIAGVSPDPRRNWVIINNSSPTSLGPTLFAEFENITNLYVEGNTGIVSENRGRIPIRFYNVAGEITIKDNSIVGSCWPYVTDDYSLLSSPLLNVSNNPVSSIENCFDFTKDQVLNAQDIFKAIRYFFDTSLIPSTAAPRIVNVNGYGGSDIVDAIWLSDYYLNNSQMNDSLCSRTTRKDGCPQ